MSNNATPFVEQQRFGEWYAWRRLSRRGEKLAWEWLTQRGWRRVRGGSNANRKPKDVLMLRVILNDSEMPNS